MKRRQFLSLLPAVATAGLGFPAIVRAKEQRFAGITLRVTGFGGDWDRIMQEHIAQPLERSTGLKVTYTPGTAMAALAKVLASPDDPPFDVVLVDNPNLPDLIKAQATTPVTARDVKAISKLLPGMREFGDYGIPFNMTALVVAYNTKLVKTPLTSFADFGRSDLKERVGLLNLENNGGLLQLIALAESNGGSVDNIDPGFAALAKLRPNIASITSSTVNMLQLFEQEEIWAGGFFDGRVYSLQKAGKPIAMSLPAEGTYSLRSYACPVKGTKYPEAVLAYLEQCLSDEVISEIATFFRFGPTTDVKLPADVTKTILLYGPEALARLKPVDWSKVAANRAAWLNRFNKEFR